MGDQENAVGPAEFAAPDSLDARNELQDELGTHPLPWFDFLRSEISLPPGGLVLELGSGSGELWQDGFGAGCRLILTDVSPGMLAAAKKNAGSLGAAAVTASAEAIATPASSADVVIAVGVLDLVPDLPSALQEIHRVLKPGGSLHVTAGGYFHLGQLEELVRPFWPEVSLGGVPEQFGVENGSGILEPWFPIVQRKVYRDELVFDRVEPILEYVLSEESIRTRLAGEVLPRFVAYVHQYLRRVEVLRVRRVKALFQAQKIT